ncbi:MULTISPECIES: MFS transporter [Francisella]|uniref:Lysosomal dipeptide transporter MFSD1 n=1 Tax=Francisella adeliensis TaxID=2007306 RepID=A0A2Z4XXP0_9GAMM|nr:MULTISPECIES: MFS transporter [Francisella]AXA33506.1 MFS transporter [Francisella adeliensis]MBK2084796.1 MFS transporter [Francisella adeliensis]MBK2097261.1 MFS transporter [Francisella adeliensis]QIW11737.1 MFS transporter [Francisella adeliensis]QIW13611.1 MFS transporter [Francisella adeliensis]
MKSTKHTLLIGWAIWIIAAVFYGLDYFQHTAPSVLIKPISDGMGVGVEDIAYIMSIYFPIYAISQVPAGILLDKFGSKVMLSFSCLVMSLGILFFVYDPSLNTMLIGRVLIAIGSAVAFIGTLKVAADVLPEKVFPIAVGLTNTIGVLGGIFGQVYLHQLVNIYGWQSALAVIGYFGVFWSIIILAFLKYSVPQDSKLSKTYLSFGESLKLLLNKRLWLLAIYAGLMVGIVVNAFSELYDVLFLEQVYGISAHIAAKISVMMFVGIAVGGPSHGFIASLFGEKRVWMLICNIITLGLFSAVILANNFISQDFLYVIFFLIGFSVSSMLLAFSVVEEIFPTQVKATALAIVNMVIGLCGAIFQYFISYISVYINGGPLTGEISEKVFDKAFIFLLLPLLVSTIIMSKLILDKYKKGV